VTGELSKLPGIGRRTALRLAIHLLRMEPDSVSNMTRSIDRFRRDIKYCKLCNNLSDEEICPICADRERDHTTVLHSLEQIEKKMKSDPVFNQTIKEITININSKR
jgi:recombinational DNA repair protein RecR